MGLLFHDLSKDFQNVAENVYQRHFIKDPKLEQEYDDYRKKKMYEDILHNLSFLEVSYTLDDPKLFHSYSIWLYELMIHLMKDLCQERIKEHMVTHYTLLKEELEKQLEKHEFEKVTLLLEDAIKTTIDYQEPKEQEDFKKDKYYVHKNAYLSYLLDGESKKAMDYILQIKNTMIPLEDIYVEILQEVMKEIGELWKKWPVSISTNNAKELLTWANKEFCL